MWVVNKRSLASQSGVATLLLTTKRPERQEEGGQGLEQDKGRNMRTTTREKTTKTTWGEVMEMKKNTKLKIKHFKKGKEQGQRRNIETEKRMKNGGEGERTKME